MRPPRHATPHDKLNSRRRGEEWWSVQDLISMGCPAGPASLRGPSPTIVHILCLSSAPKKNETKTTQSRIDAMHGCTAVRPAGGTALVAPRQSTDVHVCAPRQAALYVLRRRREHGRETPSLHAELASSHLWIPLNALHYFYFSQKYFLKAGTDAATILSENCVDAEVTADARLSLALLGNYVLAGKGSYRNLKKEWGRQT